MKTIYSKATVPRADAAILLAWQPWIWAGASINLLASPEFEGDSPFWPVHYYAAINFIVSSIETLNNEDRNRHQKFSEPFKGYFSERRRRKNAKWPDPIIDFVEVERKPFHHRGKTEVLAENVSTRPFLWDGDESKTRKGRILLWSAEGESLIRLLRIALSSLEEDLRVLDQAIYEKINKDPFAEHELRNQLEDSSYTRIKTVL